MIMGTMSRSAHCSRTSVEAGPVPHHSSEPSESLACSEPGEPPPTLLDYLPSDALAITAWAA